MNRDYQEPYQYDTYNILSLIPLTSPSTGQVHFPLTCQLTILAHVFPSPDFPLLSPFHSLPSNNLVLLSVPITGPWDVCQLYLTIHTFLIYVKVLECKTCEQPCSVRMKEVYSTIAQILFPGNTIFNIPSTSALIGSSCGSLCLPSLVRGKTWCKFGDRVFRDCITRLALKLRLLNFQVSSWDRAGFCDIGIYIFGWVLL